jgi:hypothetical protein
MAPRQPPGSGGITAVENNINAELMHMPQSVLQQLKQEAGIGTKDLPSLTLADKVSFHVLICVRAVTPLSQQRILNMYRLRKSGGQPPPINATPGPSNLMMQPPNPVRNKRSSTSPGEEVCCFGSIISGPA